MQRAASEWKTKLHPAFIEIADANKRVMLALASILKNAKEAEEALGSRITPQQKIEIANRVISEHDKLLELSANEIADIDNRYKPLPESTLCYPYLTDLGPGHRSADSESRALFEWLHWERHHESLTNATEADNRGDLSAWDRIARTARDWRTIFHKKGAIKPFQGGTYHQDIFQIGLSFASGMEKLTGEELAEFFDFFCPCMTIHDARALQKQLARLLKALETAARKS